jgi:iron-sulfur cluster assembly accessory protein
MIQVTREALGEFKRLQEGQEDRSLVLRLYARNVDGGLRYGMGWGPAEEDDIVIEAEGVSLHIEELSVPFLAGAQISYFEEELRRGFSIRPGGAGGGCACGGGGCGCGAR